MIRQHGTSALPEQKWYLVERFNLAGDACGGQPPPGPAIPNKVQLLDWRTRWAAAQGGRKMGEGAVTGWEASHSFLSPLPVAASPTLSLPRMD